MKFCIAYDSKYGNGKKCVDYLEKMLRAKGQNVFVHSIHDIKPGSIPESDTYIFSAPTHLGSTPRKMKKFLKNLNIEFESGKYSLITTCLDPDSTRSLEKMTQLIQPYGLDLATEGIKIKVEGRKGPLGVGYEKQIELFAIELMKQK